ALLNAREAYRTAQNGPASELKQSDLHDARVLLDQAEDAALHDSENWAMHRAYLAQRRAELADAQGKTAAALRAKERTEKQMQALKDKSLAATKSELAEVSAAQVETQTALSQTQKQLVAEHQSRVEMHGQLADASAAQQ